jgi:proteasome lid subunit RPN8/RPN11
MATQAPFGLSLHLFSQTWRPILAAHVEPDLAPAVEYARWEAVRHQGHPAGAPPGEATFEPLYHDSAGDPYLKGIRVAVAGRPSLLPAAYFQSLAHELTAACVQCGTLQPGDKYRYLVAAVQAQPEIAGSDGALGLEVAEEAMPIETREARLGDFIKRATPFELAENDDSMPVFIRRQVLDDALGQARGSPVEIGALLAGHLWNDPAGPETWAEITALLPVRHTEATTVRLSFTPATWATARNELARRGKEEIPLGWFHSHPGVSGDAGREGYERSFFSGQDRHVHRNVFWRGYNLALVMTELADGQWQASAWGWQFGVILRRGFYVLEE